jgi:hypothetical protein
MADASDIRRCLDIWTCEDLAQALEITTDTLRIWRSQGQGPNFVKAGRTVFYRIEDVKAWLAESRYQRQYFPDEETPPEQVASQPVDQPANQAGLSPSTPSSLSEQGVSA